MSDFEKQTYFLISRGRAVWGWEHGWRWMPRRLGDAIADPWNRIACLMLGHLWMSDDIVQPNGVMVCSYCCRTRRATEDERAQWEALARDLMEIHRERVDAG